MQRLKTKAKGLKERQGRRAQAPYDGSSQGELTTAPLRGYDGVRPMASLRLKKKQNS